MSKIIESNKITDLLLHADEKTLVVFDVDNTLIEAVDHVGNVAWFKHTMKKFTDRGMSEAQAGMRIYSLWVKLQEFYTVKTVDDNTASVVKKLHEQKIKTIGLTARGFDLAQVTIKQLASVDIAIHENSIHDQKIDFDSKLGFLKGIMFAGVIRKKGDSLLMFFDRIKFAPEKILFIDDDPKYLEEVEQTLGAQNIPFTGIRYGGADHQYQRFNPARADEELREFFAGSEHQSLVEEILS